MSDATIARCDPSVGGRGGWEGTALVMWGARRAGSYDGMTHRQAIAQAIYIYPRIYTQHIVANDFQRVASSRLPVSSDQRAETIGGVSTPWWSIGHAVPCVR